MAKTQCKKLALATIGLACFVASSARADFVPIPLDSSSFNQDAVVEATAPPPVNVAVNATVDGGTNKTGNTWFEQGYNILYPTNGVPPANSLVTAIVAPGGTPHVYQMPPDYHTNNVILVGHNAGGRTPVLLTGTFKLTTPAPFAMLSFAQCSGNGPVLVGYVVNYADSTTESNTFSSLDWFNNTNYIFNPRGRISMDGGMQNLNANPAGAVYAVDVTLGNTIANVTSIDFYYVGSGGNNNTNNNGRSAILAVSGSTDNINFNPIAVSGYNYDVIVEADGPQTTGTGQAAGYALTNNVTVSMDGGIWKNGSVWHEKGYYPGYPNCGLPAAGSAVVSPSVPAAYTMPASYAGNCATFLSSNITSANIVFATPASYAALSFLCGAANGATFLPCTISFADGTTEQNTIFVPDWFNREIPPAYIAFGRVAPISRGVNNGPDRLNNPFAAIATYGGLGAWEFRNGNNNFDLPVPRLFDSVINVTNTAAITNIALSFTNGVSTRGVSIFAVSGASAGNVPPIFGYRGTPITGQPANAQVNGIRLLKAWEGTNTIILSVTNIAGSSPISYQWKKAPRGGGFHDIFYSLDYNTFANVSDVANKIVGSTSSVLMISNAVPADTADYMVVASTAGGSVTSLVATVMILTTNQNVFVGTGSGDTVARYTTDTTTSGEGIEHVIDQVAQKWLSFSLNNNVLPFVGPIGYVATPVSGASICTSIRFFTANDSSGRDPLDYTVEGSNDGASWTRITGGVLLGTLAMPTGRNGTGSTPLDALNQNCLQVDFANAVGYKSYRVTITNTYDRLGTSAFQIGEIQLLGTLVPNPPVWVRQPEPAATVFVGASPNFTVQAGGYPPPRFQWYSNNFAGPIPGATNNTYTLVNAQLTDSGSTFGCTASNIFGSINSSLATLTVIAAPTEPYPITVIGDNPIGYWRLNEGPDNSGGDNGVVTHDYMGARNGFYSNVVIAVQGYNPTADHDTATAFGGFSTINSYVAEINHLSFERSTSAPPAAFSVEAWVLGGNQVPNAAIVAKGYAGNLNVGTGTGTDQFALAMGGGNFPTFQFLVREATGQGHLAQSATVPYDLISFQPTWHHLVGVCDQPNGKVRMYVDGVLTGSGDIGVNAGILAQPLPMTIGSQNLGGVTEYTNQWVGTIDDVAIYGTALSASQVLNHYYAGQKPPIITYLQPTNQTVADNVTATVSARAYGAGTLGYQWYLSDGLNPTTPYAGQTSSNLVFTSTPASSGNYQLIVTNQYGATTSVVAFLTVVTGVPQFITNLPAADSFLVGHVIRLSVVAGGTGPFTYQWQKNSINITDDYRTFGSQTPMLTIGYGAAGDSGTYTVIINNAGGPPATSVSDVVTVSALPAQLFNAAGTGWTRQGFTNDTVPSVPIMSDGRLQLTMGLGSTRHSAFLTAKQNVSAFNFGFVYQVTSGAGGADGATFCIQNAAAGAAALGGGGGGLGYSGITPSVALAFNIYDPNTRGIRLLQNGTVTTPFTPISPVLIGGNANPVQINLNYNGAVLGATFKDLITSSSFTTTFPIDIPGVVGDGSAYVGFTGADGGVSSTQFVTNFIVLPPPTAMTAAQVGGNLVLSWPASTGAYLQSSPSLTTPVWTQATDLFRVVGSQSTVTVTPLTGDRYFRLQLFP